MALEKKRCGVYFIIDFHGVSTRSSTKVNPTLVPIPIPREYHIYANIYARYIQRIKQIMHRDHSLPSLSQWEASLQCSVVSHWPSPLSQWSLLSIIQIYIIISKNIRYLLWNRGARRFFHDTYLTSEVQGIRCTKHLHDSCPLTDVNPHFTANIISKLTADGLLWRHRHMGQPLAIVTSQWSIVPTGFYGRMMLRSTRVKGIASTRRERWLGSGGWKVEIIQTINSWVTHLCLLSSSFSDPRVSTRGIASIILYAIRVSHISRIISSVTNYLSVSDHSV